LRKSDRANTDLESLKMPTFAHIPDATVPHMIGAEPAAKAANASSAVPGVGFAIDSAALAVEGGTDPAFGTVTWKTLISGDRTPTSEFVLGMAEFEAHGTLHPHRHAPAEFYIGMSGNGVVTIDGVAHSIAAGVAIYVPGNAEHGVVAGPEGLRFAYGFAEAAFAGIAYHFTAKAA
jgi:quercetin dioxygenase-like cupin family protein